MSVIARVRLLRIGFAGLVCAAALTACSSGGQASTQPGTARRSGAVAATGPTLPGAAGSSGGTTTTTATTPSATGGGSAGSGGAVEPAVLGAPLPTPAPLAPLSSSAPAGQGQWQPAGRPVDGVSAVYKTLLAPPGSQLEAGIAWMDTNLLAARLYSGSLSPGGGPYKYSAPIQPGAAASLVAAFNGGFQMAVANGGYYTQGKVIVPLRVGAASLVFYRNGSVDIGQWGTDVSMTSQVVGVRQNLNLLVVGGAPVPGLNPSDVSVWGATLGGTPNVWRSGIGVTASGALVYVAGPGLDIVQLADLLVAAGAVRAMEMDINPYWTCLATYDPVPPATLAAASNGTDLVSSMQQSPGLFFDPSWNRDFVTMSARSGASG